MLTLNDILPLADNSPVNLVDASKKCGTVYVLNGPNLNLLGKREPEIYGSETLSEIMSSLAEKAAEKHIEVITFQSNSERELINFIHTTGFEKDNLGIILNAGALSHYSYSVRDAISAVPAKVIEVHLSNIYARKEGFRHKSVISAVCAGSICGFGAKVYEIALGAILSQMKAKI